MASTSNPNVPRKQRRIANRAKSQRRNAIKKVAKHPRGTRQSAVLYPTSGPLAPVSGKKARKLERAQRHARQRAVQKAMAAEGEVQMTDAPKSTESKSKKENGEGMEIDNTA
ncbi:hypothetical protein ACMFMG_011331 [Clarireedia jacksonii]